MNQPTNEVSAVTVLRRELSSDAYKGEIGKALPPHIDSDKFIRVVMTAVQQDPKLLEANSTSLKGACMKCAQDGLLPDGREAALVRFWDKNLQQERVQYMPMMAGILKKVRNSGELVSLSAHVVYEKDEFSYELGDDERIVHKPFLSGDRGKEVLAYAIAKVKDGGIYREIMTRDEIEKVRAVSRAKSGGPWDSWWGEMAKKTVIRRLSKRLPMSTDLEGVVRADDELYDLPQKAPVEKQVEGTVVKDEAARPSRLQKVVDMEPEPPTVVAPANGTPDLRPPPEAVI